MTRDEIQATVHDAWRSVLGDVDIDDTLGFFDCGGDSILLIALHAHLVDAFPTINVRLVDLLRSSSIVEQSEMFRDRLQAAS